jgi:hypothetical protein
MTWSSATGGTPPAAWTMVTPPGGTWSNYNIHKIVSAVKLVHSNNQKSDNSRVAAGTKVNCG